MMLLLLLLLIIPWVLTYSCISETTDADVEDNTDSEYALGVANRQPSIIVEDLDTDESPLTNSEDHLRDNKWVGVVAVVYNTGNVAIIN